MEYQEDSQIASQQPCKILSALVRKRPGKVTGTWGTGSKHSYRNQENMYQKTLFIKKKKGQVWAKYSKYFWASSAKHQIKNKPSNPSPLCSLYACVIFFAPQVPCKRGLLRGNNLCQMLHRTFQKAAGRSCRSWGCPSSRQPPRCREVLTP